MYGSLHEKKNFLPVTIFSSNGMLIYTNQSTFYLSSANGRPGSYYCVSECDSAGGRVAEQYYKVLR